MSNDAHSGLDAIDLIFDRIEALTDSPDRSPACHDRGRRPGQAQAGIQQYRRHIRTIITQMIGKRPLDPLQLFVSRGDCRCPAQGRSIRVPLAAPLLFALWLIPVLPGGMRLRGRGASRLEPRRVAKVPKVSISSLDLCSE
jgi:hypothetical protein